MVISILTLFPELFPPIFDASILGRARKKGYLNISLIDIRDYAEDKHKMVDDKPYGGGKGMLMRVDVVHRALMDAEKSFRANHLKGTSHEPIQKVILMDPAGSVFTQGKARELARIDHLILICGHYEGIDARIERYIDEKISIGQYILTGGELPAMVVAETVSRLVPGVLAQEATEKESFSQENELEWPQYTRPETYDGARVPEVLLSGDHKKIEKWRKDKTKHLT